MCPSIGGGQLRILGVNAEGYREILGIQVTSAEDGAGWLAFFRDLVARGRGHADRVKCLHVLIAHSLAKGPGLNPFGDEALALLAAELTPICNACRPTSPTTVSGRCAISRRPLTEPRPAL